MQRVRKLNKAVGYKGVLLVTISRPTAYGEYAPYHFVDTEQEFQTIVKHQCGQKMRLFQIPDDMTLASQADFDKF